MSKETPSRTCGECGKFYRFEIQGIGINPNDALGLCGIRILPNAIKAGNKAPKKCLSRFEPQLGSED